MDEQSERPRARLSLADEPTGGGLVVRLAGELDLAAATEIAGPLDELLARKPQPILLDLEELAFLDSSGVALLIRIANHFERVEVRSATPPVRRVIEVLGLADRLGLDGA